MKKNYFFCGNPGELVMKQKKDDVSKKIFGLSWNGGEPMEIMKTKKLPEAEIDKLDHREPLWSSD